MQDDEPCDTSTISGCTTYSTYSVDSDGSTTATATTSFCQTAIGCEPTVYSTATATTVSATAASTYYAIYPETTVVTAAQIEQLLSDNDVDTTLDPNFYVSTSANLGLNFVYAGMTTAQLDAVSASNLVSIYIALYSFIAQVLIPQGFRCKCSNSRYSSQYYTPITNAAAQL